MAGVKFRAPFAARIMAEGSEIWWYLRIRRDTKWTVGASLFPISCVFPTWC